MPDSHFERDGFTVAREAISPDLVRTLRETTLELANREAADGTAHYYDGTRATQRVWNLLNKAAVFRDVIQMPLVLDAMEKIFQRDTVHQKYFLSSFQANILFPGATPQKLHIDTPVPEPLPPWVIKANSIWLLDDFLPDNGPTEVLPGSHKLPRKPRAEDQTRPDLVQVLAPAGSILFTHGALWHKSGANRTSRPRVALLGSFAASYAREIASEEDYFKVLDPKLLAEAPEKLRLILGADHGVKPGAR